MLLLGMLALIASPPCLATQENAAIDQTAIQRRQNIDEGGAQMNNHESIQAVGHFPAEQHKRTHAQAKITVQNSQSKPFDQTTSPALSEITLTERFTGDIDGEATVRALQVQQSHQATSLVSMQRFRGKLGGREGTFVLQGSETVENGKIEATWFVVPGSGTHGLEGLRGKGGFKGDFGKGSNGTLDYWFE